MTTSATSTNADSSRKATPSCWPWITSISKVHLAEVTGSCALLHCWAIEAADTEQLYRRHQPQKMQHAIRSQRRVKVVSQVLTSSFDPIEFMEARLICQNQGAAELEQCMSLGCVSIGQ